MHSVTAGLARQVLVAAALSALVLGAAVGARQSEDRHAVASESVDKPILTRAIVFADALSQALPLPVIRPPALSKAASRLACAPSCPHPAAGLAPRPRPVADAAAKPADVASAAPAPSPQFDPPSLKKRLLAPVGFVRENVARLMAWL
jgi:hypothetical protein